jgi:hypothetical protein
MEETEILISNTKVFFISQFVCLQADMLGLAFSDLICTNPFRVL